MLYNRLLTKTLPLFVLFNNFYSFFFGVPIWIFHSVKLYLLCLFSLLFHSISAVQKDEEVAAPAQEFVAADADIANYSTWTKTAEKSEGPDLLA